ncbi:AAA family ATPase [Nonomuraea sp. KM90]|uniref:AAA family ATPase n=1 Tax=Nonomuraea sp. KM90 TaxID=3457428 RepID=UPI003FCD438C
MRVLGRDSELSACRLALQAGRTPLGMLISGEPGAGKTLLCRTVAELAKASGWNVLATTGLRTEVGVPLANLADLLDPAVLGVLDLLPEVQAAALRAALRLAPASRPPEPALIARAAVAAIRALAAGRLLIVVDDEQWLDPDTRRLLGMAATWLTDSRLGWLVTVRTAHSDQGLGPVLRHELGPDLLRLDLAGLDEESLATLIGRRFPGFRSSGLIQRIVTLAAGNPYAALELARETAREPKRGSVRVPTDLSKSLRDRLERLPPPSYAAVQVAALCRRPTRRLLRVLFGERADAAVDEALEADILAARPPDPVLTFTHPLLSEVAQATLTGPALRKLHRRLAAATEDPDEAAGHLAAGAEEPDEELAATVHAAAERMFFSGAPTRAGGLAGAAVSLTPDQRGAPAWRRKLFWLDCLVVAAEWNEAQSLAGSWLADVPVELRGEFMARAAKLEADVEESVRLFTIAADDFRDRPGRAAEVNSDLAVTVGVLLLRLSEGRAHAEKAVRQAPSAGDPVVLRKALGYHGWLSFLSGDPEAGKLLRAAADVPGLADMRIPYQAPELKLALWHVSRGEIEPAMKLMRTVIQVAEHRGARESVAGVWTHLVEAQWRAGMWREAREHATAVERHERETGNLQPGVTAYEVSLVAASYGEVDRARAVAAEGIVQAEEQNDLAYSLLCRSVLGFLELSLDEPAAALGWLHPLVERLRGMGIVDPGAFPIFGDVIEAYARVGRLDEAEAELRLLQGTAAHLDHPWARITGGRAAAVLHLARRDPVPAAEAATDAAAEARDRGLPLELGRCLLVLGTAQRRGRLRRAAARTLNEATALFVGLGARCWADLAATQQARLTHAGDGVLTPAEKRVAELVILGGTNAEIAATMMISVKTVEANLTRIYRKLGVRGRLDLARRGIT